MCIFLVGCNDGRLNDSSVGNAIESCNATEHESNREQFGEMNRALLATRFQNLEDLQKVIEIEYYKNKAPYVILSHCSRGLMVTSTLDSGIHEGDFRNARDGDFFDKLHLLLHSPFAVIHRDELRIISAMARRKPEFYGEGDVAFYDLAEKCVAHILEDDIAKLSFTDTSEKGFINTFNHITAQALVTSILSEEMADFIADAHERFHMPELLSGNFSPEQLTDKDKNPMDNYVDIINNEWGQEIGKDLKLRYKIEPNTVWTNELLANYMNDLQSHYCWSFHIGFKPFKASDELIQRFVAKLNHVMHKAPLS